MRNGTVTKLKGPEHLSVIHKAAAAEAEELFRLNDAVIQTDLELNITGWNGAAEALHGQTGAMGRNLFELVELEFVNSSPEMMKEELLHQSCWTGEVIFHRHDGQHIHLRCAANSIINEYEEPVAILIVAHNISDLKAREKEVAMIEHKYETLVNTLTDGVLMMNRSGLIEACNSRAAEILEIPEAKLLQTSANHDRWKAIRPDGSEFQFDEMPAVLTMRTGQTHRNVVMGITTQSGKLVWLQLTSQPVFNPPEDIPYAVTITFSDITEKIRSEEELRKTNERLYYAGQVASDAIWDLDLQTNEIYRNDAFKALSGYSDQEISPDLDWWFERTHPDDKERVRHNVRNCIETGLSGWQDEYRFLCANGEYKYLLDKGIILYRNEKPVRIIGAIQDLTERKLLEEKLLNKEIQKQKQLSQATIIAQEQERNNISRELHDNVNQILISARLFMNSALKDPEQRAELLQKAVEYQSLALEEIRKLSKSLSTSLVKTIGLKECVDDIVYNMRTLEKLDVEFKFNQRVAEKLSEDQQLMLFRIIQEQTSNIIKYAQAGSVKILLNETGGNIHLLISDDGKGFDVKQRKKGIGLVNIMSRVEAFNGKVNIISSPGNGCTLEVQLPATTDPKA